MVRKVFIVFVILIILMPQQATATDSSSPFLPEIQSLTWSGLTYLNGDGSKSGASQTRFDLTVRVHRNSITRLEVTWTSFNSSYKPGPLDPPCSGQISLLAGDSEPGLDSPLLNLVSRAKDGEWFVEKYEVIARTYQFTYPLCPTEFQVAEISLFDELARYVSVNSVSQRGSLWEMLPADSPSIPCTLMTKKAQRERNSWANCNHKVDWNNLSFKIDNSSRIRASMPEVVNYVSELIELKSEFKTLKTFASDLSSKVASSEAELNQIKVQLSTSLSEKVQLRIQVDKLVKDNSIQGIELSNLAIENLKLKEQASTLSSQNAFLQKRLAMICKARPKPRGC